jgi:aryl carrier-like protein
MSETARETETARERVFAAVGEVLYVAESDLVDGDATDLRDLGLDSVRFVLVMKQLGVSQQAELISRLADHPSIAGWVHELEKST